MSPWNYSDNDDRGAQLDCFKHKLKIVSMQLNASVGDILAL